MANYTLLYRLLPLAACNSAGWGDVTRSFERSRGDELSRITQQVSNSKGVDLRQGTVEPTNLLLCFVFRLSTAPRYEDDFLCWLPDQAPAQVSGLYRCRIDARKIFTGLLCTSPADVRGCGTWH